MEIAVKDGKVTINGEEIEEGEAFEFSEGQALEWHDEDGNLHVTSPGQHYFFSPDRNIKFPEGQFDFSEMHIDMEAQQNAIQQMQKDMKYRQRDALQMQRDVERSAREMERATAKGFAFGFPGEIRVEHPELVRVFGNRGGFTNRMLEELQRDYLVTDIHNYSYELSAKKLKVNGKKQPDNLHKKYLNMYEEHTGKTLSGKDTIQVTIKD